VDDDSVLNFLEESGHSLSMAAAIPKTPKSTPPATAAFIRRLWPKVDRVTHLAGRASTAGTGTVLVLDGYVD